MNKEGLATTIAVLILGLLALFYVAYVRAQSSIDLDLLNERLTEMTRAYNDWNQYAITLSPDSPDFSERIRERWLRNEVGEKFRRVEDALEATQ